MAFPPVPKNLKSIVTPSVIAGAGEKFNPGKPDTGKEAYPING
jgi:hypothetical protein